MSELSKQADHLLVTASKCLDILNQHEAATNAGAGPSLELVSASIALAQATATLALCQATEAQTDAIIRFGGRR